MSSHPQMLKAVFWEPARLKNFKKSVLYDNKEAYIKFCHA